MGKGFWMVNGYCSTCLDCGDIILDELAGKAEKSLNIYYIIDISTYIMQFKIIFGIFAAAFLVAIGLVSAGEVMQVETNVFSLDSPTEIVSIEVPDYLFFGNLTPGGESEEFKIYINNTGNTAVRVTPQLVNSPDEIFENLYFRETKTSNYTAVPFERIGIFDFEISKPTASTGVKSKYVYVKLDLEDFDSTLNEDLIGIKNEVKFYAVVQ